MAANSIHVHPSGIKEGRSVLWLHNEGRVPVTLSLDGFECHLVLDGLLRLPPGALVNLTSDAEGNGSLAVVAVDDAPLPRAEPVMLPEPRRPDGDTR